MAYSFVLSCESTVDLPYEYVAGRDISILYYTYSIDGVEYVDDMGKDPNSIPNFYKMLEVLDEGHLPSTSQINTYTYKEYFQELLKEGDVLHINFGSGMSASVKNAQMAAEELMEENPGRTVCVIDSYCSSSGYGLLVDDACDLRDEGKSLEEVRDFVLSKVRNVHHQFFSTDLKYFKRSGRVSGAAATVGAVLGICPIMRLNYDGCIIAYDKVRGKPKAIQTTIKTMEEHAEGGRDYNQKCFICHSNCLEIAEKTKAAVAEHFPHIKGDIRICDIGTIIAAHSGPGTVAVFFYGDERPK